MSDDTGAQIWAMAHLATPMALRVIATLRVADHLAAGHRSAAELATATGTDQHALERVLRHLADKGVLVAEANGYRLTPQAEPLRSDHPAGIRAMLDIDGAVGRAELSFVQLLHSVRTGEAAFPVQFGLSFWDDLDREPERAASFNDRMAADLAVRGPDLVRAYDWGSLGHLVDVGGGNGTLVRDLLTAHPALRATVFDLPEAAEAAERVLAEGGVADRANVVAGSFFEQLPDDGEAYLLSSIIHDWADEPAVRILRRCAAAAGPGGSVFVAERIGASGAAKNSTMDLRMLAYYGGKERDVDELSELADRAGLAVTAVHAAGVLALLELVVR
ncbi:methyltransferase [Saccharopolyspora indica]|uniref:methyltransferase n=1 Tax=Saccharopolyspora indica TaxID=1229659 RepID=UPI0022EB1934|nr:methyltransferase [Saccharopolyspora indica]MDA3647032.1 methyltransferase [Saccharopolyspora indica]